MPTPGLSLVGFMDEQSALKHLRVDCIPPDPTEPASRAAWQTAQGRLGAPIANAGNPAIDPIPPSHVAYILQVTQLPHVAAAMQTDLAGATFQMVEIDPLLISASKALRSVGSSRASMPR